MAEELKYTSKYDGATTDDLLGYAQEAKGLDSNANVQEAKKVGVNAYVKESKELKSNEYVRSMKEQLAAEDAETVQVYDVEGVPHKISKKELISKAGIQLPSLEEIGGFVAYDTNGQALGLMSKEQVAEVVGGLIGESNHRTFLLGQNETRKIAGWSDGLYYMIVSKEANRLYFSVTNGSIVPEFSGAWFSGNIEFSLSSDGFIQIKQKAWSFNISIDVYKVS